ncbi:MAG: DUF4091 domain-containing protein [Clostridia bacterium]|nr:DUF4091 domain-containing protein [Clostridia bacterium]
MSVLTVGSYEKVLIGKKPKTEKRGTMAKNEVYSFQVAYMFEWHFSDIEVRIESPIKDFITYRQVEYVNALTPNFTRGDDYAISDKPFMCPDVLRPCKNGRVIARHGMYNTLWFTVKGDVPVGKHKIKIGFFIEGKEWGSTVYSLEVLDIELSHNHLTYTNWFHYDSIANYYNVPVFSKRYNEIMDKYIECAVNHGVNMLLIPMFTPPLDTRIGRERLTVQLIDVYQNKGEYSFDFTRLIDFMRRVESLGIKYFEMSHLFTQWGAHHAPKIMGVKDGKRVRLFGWETDGNGEEYKEFLSRLLPELSRALKAEGLFERCRFHISDEPNEKCLDNYKSAKEIFKKYLPDGIITDALSHYDFYSQGLVDRAICATDASKPFLENNVPDLWVYYCCAQSQANYSNRFMAFPGMRNRVIGMQMYLNNVKGFLHWGYNFYNCVLSDWPIDPYVTNDGCGGYQSGDPFVVYPGDGEPYDSVRHENFYDGLQDYRLFMALEEKVGRAKAEALLLENGFEKDFVTYPHGAKELLSIREKAQRMLLETK